MLKTAPHIKRTYEQAVYVDTCLLGAAHEITQLYAACGSMSHREAHDHVTSTISNGKLPFGKVLSADDLSGSDWRYGDYFIQQFIVVTKALSGMGAMEDGQAAAEDAIHTAKALILTFGSHALAIYTRFVMLRTLLAMQDAA